MSRFEELKNKIATDGNYQEGESCYFYMDEISAFKDGWDSCAAEYEKLIAEKDVKLKIAVEALRFYADGDSWGHESPTSTTYSVIDRDDLGDGSFYLNEITDDEMVGGKKAREALKEIEGK